MAEADPQIDSLIQRFNGCWNEYDARGIASLFAADADLTNAFGIGATGRDAIERFHAALFASVFKDSKIHGAITRTRPIRPDVVMIDLHWSVTGMKAREEDRGGEILGVMAMLLTRHGDDWLITTMHVMQFPPGQPAVRTS